MNCCSGDSIEGVPCTPNQNGNYECSWECSDENRDENGMPDPCHPHYDSYARCVQREKDVHENLLGGLKDELETLGGLLRKGMLSLGDDAEAERLFDRNQCSSRDACLQILEREIGSLKERLVAEEEKSRVDVEQAKERYRLDSSDVCMEVGDDGYCQRFRTTEVPTKFMLVVDASDMPSIGREYDDHLKQAAEHGGKRGWRGVLAPSGVYSVTEDSYLENGVPDAFHMDISDTPYCLEGERAAFALCDPGNADQHFEFYSVKHQGKACDGTRVLRDASAPLDGYSEASCKHLCDRHDQCFAATFSELKEVGGKIYSGYCELYGTLDKMEDSSGSTCMVYQPMADHDGVRSSARVIQGNGFLHHSLPDVHMAKRYIR